jgi:uncharacterized membrane protein YfcA
MGSLLTLAVIFFIVSIVFSMIGMGGGILYVPILLFAGYSFKEAPSVSLILIAATSVAALTTFWKNKKIDFKLALIIDPATDVMAFLGGYYSSFLPENALKVLLVIILIIAGILMVKNTKMKTKNTKAKSIWWWHRKFNNEKYSVNLPLVIFAAGLVGVLSGMLGITGGIIKLPIMVLLCGVPMDIAVATSTVMVAITALSGLAGHSLHGQVNWQTGFILAIATVLGGLIGSRISLKTDKKKLKKIFGVILLLTAFKFILQLI